MKFFINSLLIVTLGVLQAHADQSSPARTITKINDFDAHYNILHKGDIVGKGVRKLSTLKNGDIKYSYHTDIDWYIFSDTRTESSILTVENSVVTPKEYIYQREGTGRDKYLKWTFSKENGSASYINEKDEETSHKIKVDFTKNPQDSLSYHLQQRLNLIKNPEQAHFVYPVIQKSGAFKNYVYEYDGEEELTLPYGNIKTVRFKREVTRKKRITYAWFAPELNYLLVRLHQIKDGSEQFEARLNNYIEKNIKEETTLKN